MRQQFTRAVMDREPAIDSWLLYRALSKPLEGLSAGIQIEMVTLDNLDEMIDVVCADLASSDADGTGGQGTL